MPTLDSNEELEARVLEELATLAYAVSDDYRYESIEAAKKERHITKYTVPDLMQLIKADRAKLIEDNFGLHDTIMIDGVLWEVDEYLGSLNQPTKERE